MLSDLDRYARQTVLPEIGIAGQERLLTSSVAVVGCGALGTVIASTLVRSGVGRVRIIDRDYIELNNLQRQILFDEEDIDRGLPKAIAAAEKLRKVNSQVEIEPIVADVNPDNVERLSGLLAFFRRERAVALPPWRRNRAHCDGASFEPGGLAEGTRLDRRDTQGRRYPRRWDTGYEPVGRSDHWTYPVGLLHPRVERAGYHQPAPVTRC